MSNRINRIVKLLVMLQAGLRCHAPRLASETGVHRRTVSRDVATLRCLGFPILFDVETACYRLSGSVSSNSIRDVAEFRRVLLAIRAKMECSEDKHPRKVLQRLLEESMTLDENQEEEQHLVSLPESFYWVLKAIRQGATITIESRQEHFPKTVLLFPTELCYRAEGWEVLGLDPTGREISCNLAEVVGCASMQSPDRVAR